MAHKSNRTFYFSSQARRGRILDAVNKLLNNETHERIADPDEQTIAYLTYKDANARSSTQNAAIVVATSALLVAIVFAMGAALESVQESSVANDAMQITDRYYSAAFAGVACVLVVVLIALGVTTSLAVGVAKRAAAFEVVRNRSNLVALTRIQSGLLSAPCISGERRVYALVNVNK